MQSSEAITADERERPVFAAVIRPYRSLGPSGFRVLMVACVVVTGLAAIRVATLGFWPISGFLLFDILALYIAFRISYRRADAFEELVLTPIELLFRRVSHRGEKSEWRLNPLWTKLDRDTDEEFGLQRLTLVSRGQRILIARELSPGEREHFADELGRALAQVKRGF
ncbi:MAG TPA: DUF2244 domain-containing protein [Enterovirga sp.]